MKNKIKLLILLMLLISTNLLSSDLLLSVQNEIPDNFIDGIKEVLGKQYNVKTNRIDQTTCLDSKCLDQISRDNSVNNVVSIIVNQKNDQLIFKSNIKNNSNFIKIEENFTIDDETALYNFSKKFGNEILAKLDFKKEIKKEKIKNKKKVISFNKRNHRYSFGLDKKRRGLREKRNLGVTIGVLGNNILGVNIDYFLSENINLELSSIAHIPIVIGFSIFINPKDNTSLYFGVHVMPIPTETAIYIPAGVQYMNDNGFTVSGELGLLYAKPFLGKGKNEFLPWGGIKIGYHF